MSLGLFAVVGELEDALALGWDEEGFHLVESGLYVHLGYVGQAGDVL